MFAPLLPRPATVFPRRGHGTATAAPTPTPETHLAIITPPRASAVLWPAQAEFVAGLRDTVDSANGVALEIAGRGSEGVRYYARAATARDLRALERKVSTGYPNATIRRVTDPAADPARAMAGRDAVAREFRLRGPVERPLRPALAEETPRQILSLLRDLHRLPEGVTALCQLVIWPAPDGWGERIEDDVHARDLRARSGGGEDDGVVSLVSPLALAALLPLAAAGSAVYAFYAFTRNPLLLVFAALALLAFAAGGVVYWRARRGARRAPTPQAEAPTAYRGYTARLRVAVSGGAPEDRDDVLDALTASYASYEQANSNGFVHAPCDPAAMVRLAAPRADRSFRRPLMVLNAAEIAALTRLPEPDEDAPGVQLRLNHICYPSHPSHQRGLPMGVVPPDDPAMIGAGLPCDAPERDDMVRVCLPYSAVEKGHMVVLGSTGGGKSIFIERLIYALKVLERRRTQVILFDPHADLVRNILGWFPFKGGPTPIVLNFADPDFAFGFNPLDVTMLRPDERVVGNLITAFQRLFEGAWGGRMEDAFRYAVETLLEANHSIVDAGGDPGKQYTILDISDLLELRSFRQDILRKRIRSYDLLKYWRNEYDAMTPQMHEAQIKPVITKIGKIRSIRATRRVFGQRKSTIVPRHLIDSGASIFIDSNEWVLSAEGAALLDSVLINEFCDAISERPKGAPDSLLVVDEFQHASAKWKENFRNIRKRNGRIVVASQSLGGIEEVEEGLKANVINNVASGTRVVFPTGDPDDNAYLAKVLDEAVTPTDIQNLSTHECYIKTVDGREKLPVVSVLVPLPPPSTEGSAAFLRRASLRRYAVPGAVVDRARQAWNRHLYFASQDEIDNNADYHDAQLNAEMLETINQSVAAALAADRAADAAAHAAATVPVMPYGGTAPATPGPGRKDHAVARRAVAPRPPARVEDDDVDDMDAPGDPDDPGIDRPAASVSTSGAKLRWTAAQRAARDAARAQADGCRARQLSFADEQAAGEQAAGEQAAGEA